MAVKWIAEESGLKNVRQRGHRRGGAGVKQTQQAYRMPRFVPSKSPVMEPPFISRCVILSAQFNHRGVGVAGQSNLRVRNAKRSGLFSSQNTPSRGKTAAFNDHTVYVLRELTVI